MSNTYLVIINDNTLFPYAMTLAYSLRKSITLNTIILLVPNKTSDNIVLLMMKLYDHVIKSNTYPEAILLNPKSVIVDGKFIDITEDSPVFNSFFRKVIKLYPEIKYFKEFHDTIRNNLTFNSTYLRQYSGLKRSNYVFDVTKLYGIDVSTFNKNNLEYYHTDITKDYLPTNIDVLFSGIKEYDFIEPINRLRSNYTTSYFDQVQDQDNYRDFIMTYYVQCRPKCSIMLSFSFNETDLKELSKYGNVYYHKKISMTLKGMKNLLFVLYDDITFNARTDIIKSLEINDTINVIVFDNINNEKLSAIKDKFNILRLSEHFYQTVLYSQYLFNQNSIDFLNKATIVTKWSESNIKFNTFKKIVYLNMNLQQINNLLMISGSVLQAYGLRSAFDIDAIIIDSKLNMNKMYDFISTNIKDFPFIADVGIMNTSNWRDTWTEKNDQILKTININNTYDLTLDPANYFYYNGMKHATIKFEITKKLQRIFNNISRDAPKYLYDIADLVLLYSKQLFDKQLTLPIKNDQQQVTQKLVKIITKIYKLDFDQNIIRKFVSEKLNFIG